MPQHHKSNHFSSIALLIGEPARASMLWKIMDGGAHTATDLAIAADISAQSASMHLGKLVDAGLLSVVRRGRMKYYQFSNPNVAYVMEAISNLMPQGQLLPDQNTLHEPHIKHCRTCYDHLAGKVGVAITDALLSKEIIKAQRSNFVVSKRGLKWFADLDISVTDLQQNKRALARKCLDWSERRPHLAGSLGAALTNRFFEDKWLQRMKGTRAVAITPLGLRKIYDLLGVII